MTYENTKSLIVYKTFKTSSSSSTSSLFPIPHYRVLFHFLSQFFYTDEGLKIIGRFVVGSVSKGLRRIIIINVPFGEEISLSVTQLIVSTSL